MLSVVMLNVVSQSKKWTGKPARVSDEEKSSITLTPGVNVIKKFPLSLTTRPNKLDRLFLASFYGCGLLYKTHPRNLGRKFRVARDKRSSLVGLFISVEEKKFNNIDLQVRKIGQRGQGKLLR